MLVWLALLLVALLVRSATAQAAGPAVAVFPVPGSRMATPQTQVTFRGISASALGSISVSGSRSGADPGRIAPDSDGQGASFLPAHPFVAGEVVTVRTALNILGARNGTFSFTIGQRAGGIAPPGVRTVAPRVPGDVDSFRSRPDLHPAAVRINQGRPIGNDLFLTPMRGPVQWGPEIVDPAGRLVWFQPLPGSQQEAADLRVQAYDGQPVLTWWQGYQNAGLGKGEDVIFDRHYRQIATVQAGNGLHADLHEFTITPQGTALITAYRLVRFNDSAVGGIGQGAVQDCVVQEIDIPTGLVLFQWDSLDHVPLTDSYLRASKQHRPYDYFHVNSVQEAADGSLVVSARNTWAIYDIDHRSGKVIWTLGGKRSDFRMSTSTRTAFQHHARLYPGGLMTVFDDGAAPQVHPQSRGLLERVDPGKRTVTLVRELDHSPQLVTPYEGSVQALGDRNLFVGWGALPYFTEFGAQGRQIYDGRFVDENSSYRAYRFAWSGQPDTQPDLAVWGGGGGAAHLDASWNGATGVRSWRVLAGPRPDALAPVGGAPRHGFETDIPVHSGEPYFAVQALGSDGLLATSAAKALPAHVAIFGRSAFVSGGWVGGLPVYCYAPHPCQITTTVQTGRATIAKTPPVTVAAGGDAIVHFKLTRAGHGMLMSARGRHLPVRVSAAGPAGIGGSTTLTLIPVFTAGHGPPRAVSQSATLQIVGLTDFVPSHGNGGILAACRADVPCQVSTTLSVGSTTIARTGPEFLGARQLGYLSFALTPAGRTMLAQAPGNHLGATLTISGAGQTATGQISLAGFS